jgi:hypothetical protein
VEAGAPWPYIDERGFVLGLEVGSDSNIDYRKFRKINNVNDNSVR